MEECLFHTTPIIGRGREELEKGVEVIAREIGEKSRELRRLESG
jgi:hypothetical protein